MGGGGGTADVEGTDWKVRSTFGSTFGSTLGFALGFALGVGTAKGFPADRKTLWRGWGDVVVGHSLGSAGSIHLFFHAAALVGVEDAFAETDVLRGGFDEFVGGDIFDGAFEGELEWWWETVAFFGASAAEVGEVFFLAGVDWEVIGAGVFADDHACVDVVAWGDEEFAADAAGFEAVACADAGFHADEGAAGAGGDGAGPWAVFLEEVAHDPVTAGHVHEFEFEADEASGGDGGLDEGGSPVGLHVNESALAFVEAFEDAADVFFGDLDVEGFVRFVAFACLVAADDDVRAGDEEFEAFAAHLFDEDGDLHGSAGGDGEDAGEVGVGDVDGDIGFGLAHEAVADLATGDVLAFAACAGAVVHGELHADGGRVDVDEGDGDVLVGSGEGFADVDVFEAGDADDVTGLGDFARVHLEGGVFEDPGDFGADFGAVLAHEEERVAFGGFAAEDLAHGDPADVVVVADIAGEHAEGAAGVGFGWRDVSPDAFEEGHHVSFFVGEIGFEVAVACGAVVGGGVELVFGGVEFEEEFEDLVMHARGVGVIAVDFIDDDDGFEAFLEGFAEDEAGLGLGAFVGVDDEEDAIDHFHDAFDFGSEVGVAGGIDDIDDTVAPADGGIFGADGDAFFLFEVHAVHGAFFDDLVVAEGTACAEEFIDESGFAVIDVGDDGDIADMIVH